MMFNPYEGNDEAAEYLNQRSSKTWLKDSVERLYYHGGTEHRSRTLREIENQVYPPMPRKVVTKEEVEQQVKHMVDDFVQRREEHKRVIEREMYAEVRSPITTQHDKVEKPVTMESFERMHKLAMHRQALKKKEREEYLARFPKKEKPPTEEEKRRERNFKPLVHIDPWKEDLKAILAADVVPGKSPRRKEGSTNWGHGFHGEAKKEYYDRLAKPFEHSKTEKVKVDRAASRNRFITNVKYGKR